MVDLEGGVAINETKDTVTLSIRFPDFAMATQGSFGSFEQLKRTSIRNPRFFQEGGGWLVAFDMDEASKIEDSQREKVLGIFNSILIDAFPHLPKELFSTTRTSHPFFLYKEEGYMYIPNGISEEELGVGLQNIRSELERNTQETARFAIVEGKHLGGYFAANPIKGLSSGGHIDLMESEIFEELLDKAKKEEGAKYGKGIVFYEPPKGGIDLTPARMNLESK